RWPPDRLRRDAAPGPGAVRLRGGGPGRARPPRPGPGRPAGLLLDQRRAPSVDDRPQPLAQVRADLADLVLTVPAGPAGISSRAIATWRTVTPTRSASPLRRRRAEG